MPEDQPPRGFGGTEDAADRIVSILNSFGGSVEGLQDALGKAAEAGVDWSETQKKTEGPFKKGAKSFIGSLQLASNASIKAGNLADGLAKKNMITGKKYNFFEEQRRLETIRNIRAFTSFRAALMFSVGVLKGIFVKAAKTFLEVFEETGVVMARFGKEVDTAFNMKFVNSLIAHGATVKEAAQANYAAIRQGFDPNTKGLKDLASRSILLGLDLQGNMAIAKKLTTMTGMSHEQGIESVNTMIDFGAQFGVDSNRLITALQELAPALQRISLAAGPEAAQAYGKAMGLLTAQFGTAFEEPIADLLQGLNSSQFRTFVTQAMFQGGAGDVDALSGKRGGVALTQAIRELAAGVQGSFGGAGGGGGGPQGAMLNTIFSNMAGLSENQLQTLLRIAQGGDIRNQLTTDQILELRRNQLEIKKRTSLQTTLNTIMGRLFLTVGRKLLPIFMTIQQMMEKHADSLFGIMKGIFNKLVEVAKWTFNAFKVLVFIKLLTIAGNFVRVMMLAVTALTSPMKALLAGGAVGGLGGAVTAAGGAAMRALAGKGAQTAAGGITKTGLARGAAFRGAGGRFISNQAARLAGAHIATKAGAAVLGTAIAGTVGTLVAIAGAGWLAWDIFSGKFDGLTKSITGATDVNGPLNQIFQKNLGANWQADWANKHKANQSEIEEALAAIDKSNSEISDHTDPQRGALLDSIRAGNISQSQLTQRILEELKISNEQRDMYYFEERSKTTKGATPLPAIK